MTVYSIHNPLLVSSQQFSGRDKKLKKVGPWPYITSAIAGIAVTQVPELIDNGVLFDAPIRLTEQISQGNVETAKDYVKGVLNLTSSWMYLSSLIDLGKAAISPILDEHAEKLINKNPQLLESVEPLTRRDKKRLLIITRRNTKKAKTQSRPRTKRLDKTG